MDRLPAIPIIANDPYFSYWLPGDLPTDAQTRHWAGNEKPIVGTINVDGKNYRFLGGHNMDAAKTLNVTVTPTRTIFLMQAGQVELQASFWSPALPDDLDTLSVPITFADFTLRSLDDQVHQTRLSLSLSSALCYDGNAVPPLLDDHFIKEGVNLCYVGQKKQNVLGHSGDHITMDWGYLYLGSFGEVTHSSHSLGFVWNVTADEQPQSTFCMAGYDDIASINYFGTPCKAWFARSGKTLVDEMIRFANEHDSLLARCVDLDQKVNEDALSAAGEDYRLITSAAWRHTFAAHKLIATPAGEMALLSKENDSNGCIGTVDVSYPSTPLFLKYCPELVNALSRPVLEFASLPVWKFDFAPHDVGRYPQAIGQVYAAKPNTVIQNGDVYPPFYLYGTDSDIYDFRYQMPVEECGNMLVMIYSAIHFGADDQLAAKYMTILDQWVHYLDTYGEDPGEQLCTDDFAGHLAHNINLSAKAIVGIACYAKLLLHFGRNEESLVWEKRAKAMAESFLIRTNNVDRKANVGLTSNEKAPSAGTPLTYDGQGWSQKYNLVWDLVLGLDLLPKDFYDNETRSYLPRLNRFGLPLDSRADYTKSDWECWCAAMAQSRKVREDILAPIAVYLRETTTRVPFSDWYDTKTSQYVAFIARSVQGGVYMPLLIEADK